MKISNFSFTFKLNNKKKVPLKKFGFEKGIGIIFNKKGSGEVGEVLTRKGWWKNRSEGCDPQGNYGCDHCHRLGTEKGWIPNKVAVVQHLFLCQNYLVTPICSTLWKEQITKNLFAKVPQAQNMIVMEFCNRRIGFLICL